MSLSAFSLLPISLIAVAFAVWLRFRPLRRQMFRNCGPTIERLQYEMSLVTLRVPICDVIDASLKNRFGTSCVTLLVKGDVDFAINFRDARLQESCHEARLFIVHLPPPSPRRPRLDHERLVVHSIRRSWLAPKTEEAMNYALREAQRSLENAVQSEDLIEEAKARASQHVTRLLRDFGYSARIVWLEGQQIQAESPLDRLSQSTAIRENEVVRSAA